MARYPDAVGHLRDLATEVDQPWFSFLCDYSIARGNTPLDEQKLAKLLEIWVGKETYTSATTPPTNAVVNTPVIQSDKLQRLFAFKNFKLLSETLDVNFTKPITVIFGTNGSGKSSLFEGIKVLANPELPSRPVKNLRVQVSTPSEFQYQFDCDPSPHTWTEAMGHGPLSMTIKYFDSSVAMRNVKVAVEPERIIEVTPFKLSLFETLTGHITTFRKELQRLQSMNITDLTLASQSVRVAFQKYPSTTASMFGDRSLALIEADIKLGEQFSGQDLLVAKTADLKELTRATSSEGLTALRTEHRDLKSLISSLSEIHTLATTGWALNFAETASLLVQKRMEQRTLAEAFIPKGVALETFMALLEVTSAVCSLAEAKGHSCPLCQRELGEYEVELFRRYHELLNGLIEKDIENLQTSLARAEEYLTGISKIRPELWKELVTIPPDLIVEAIDVTKAILADSSAVRDPSPQSLAALLSLDTLVQKISALAETKKSTIEAAATGRTALLSQLTALQQQVDQLEYANAVAKDLVKFKAVEQRMKLANYWDETVTIFPPLLRKVTAKAKTAYIDLVVSDFETRLNAEYLSRDAKKRRPGI